MKFLLAIFTFTFLVTGCIPLRQEVQVSGPPNPSALLCDDRYLLVSVDLKREQIVLEQSHITDPNGTQYSIEVGPHQYDIDQKHAFLRADVYPCESNGSRLRRWSNGIWSFHFVLEKNGVTQVIDQRWKYWTFYYNPIIHGPPN